MKARIRWPVVLSLAFLLAALVIALFSDTPPPGLLWVMLVASVVWAILSTSEE